MSNPQNTNSETTTTPTNSPNRTPRPAFPQKTSWNSGRSNENKHRWGQPVEKKPPKTPEQSNTACWGAPQPKPSPQKQKENTAPLLKLKWTKEEDEILADCIEMYGLNSWNTVSANIKGTTPRQCKERYDFYLKHAINTGPYTLEEDLKLMKLVQELGNNWDKIKEYFQDKRTASSLKNHFRLITENYKVNKTPAKIQAELIMEKYHKKNQQQEENLVQTTKETTSIGVQTMEIPDIKVYSLFIDLLAEFDTKFNKIMEISRNE